MTQKLTLTVINGKDARLLPVREAVPEADNTNTIQERQRARADSGAALAAILGVEASTTDMQDIIAREVAGGRDEADAMAIALRHTGLLAEFVTTRAPEAAHWPALAYMTSGQVLLVLGQSRGELTLYDKTCPDNGAVTKGGADPQDGGQGTALVLGPIPAISPPDR